MKKIIRRFHTNTFKRRIKRPKKYTRSFSIKHKQILFLLFSIGIGVLFLLLLISQLKIKTVRIYGTDTVYGLSQFDNKYIFLVDSEEAEKDLLQRNKHLESVSIQKNFPNVITVFADKEKPHAYLIVSEGYYVLNRKGKIIEKSQSEKNRNVIKYYQDFPYSSYRLGDVISNKDIQDALYFIEALEEYGYSVSHIDIKGFYMIRLETSDLAVLFTSEKEKELQVYQFKEVVKQIKRGEEAYSQIDVRFNKPIVSSRE